MSCRDEILICAKKLIKYKGENEFTIRDILECMRRHGTKHLDSTIRTHITSRLCANAPDHHAVTYSDLERIARGVYRLRTIPATPSRPTSNLSQFGLGPFPKAKAGKYLRRPKTRYMNKELAELRKKALDDFQAELDEASEKCLAKVLQIMDEDDSGVDPEEED
jgi:hypothetical protein